MKLGLIGYPLGHSWSPEIHRFTIRENYQLWPITEEELDAFFEKKDFDGINVTIPYKQAVMRYLDELDDTAKEIGAVNTIVNDHGKLKGYNTDYEGLVDMIQAKNISLDQKKTAVLGTGGVSKAAVAAVKKLGGIPVFISRSDKPGSITYEQFYETIASFQVLINATPVGMSPNCDEIPVKIDVLDQFDAIIDIIANPLTTRLLFEAKKRRIPCAGGFEMLVRQAIAADRYFLNQEMDPHLTYSCMNELYKEKRNIVLIGMPTSGKTTISKMLEKRTGMKAIEMDDELEKILGTTIKQCFAEKGEAFFRKAESDYIRSIRKDEKMIISCGGGVIKNDDNMRLLNENGIVVWIRRDLNKLYPTNNRPLASNEDALVQLYNERKGLYEMYSDVIVDNDGTLEEAVEKILEVTGEKTSQ